jgi:hypothetical protein
MGRNTNEEIPAWARASLLHAERARIFARKTGLADLGEDSSLLLPPRRTGLGSGLQLLGAHCHPPRPMLLCLLMSIWSNSIAGR